MGRLEKYYNLSEANGAKDPAAAEAMEKALINELAKITKFDNGGVSFVVDPDKGLHQNLADAKAFLQLSNGLSKILPSTVQNTVVSVADGYLETNRMVFLGGNKISYLGVVYEIVGDFRDQGG